MSKITKRYQLLKDTQLSTTFQVNGNTVPVTFQHGITRPYLIRGRFTTSDPELQAAIEADNSFNILFYLEHTDGAEPVKVEVPETVVPEVVEEVVPETTEEVPAAATEETPAPVEEVVPEVVEVKPEVPAITDYPEITNLQEAKQKLLELFPGELKPANMPNAKAVINRAKERNVTFSKLV